MNKIDKIELFAVQNSQGKWFRRKGYGGYGDSWVDDFKKARIYNQIGHARRTVSFFYNNYEKYDPPHIVKFIVTEYEILDETDRLQKQKEKIAQEEAHRAEYWAKQELEQAQKKLQEAQRVIERLK